jgi:hypothetical protein
MLRKCIFVGAVEYSSNSTITYSEVAIIAAVHKLVCTNIRILDMLLAACSAGLLRSSTVGVWCPLLAHSILLCM